MNYYYRDGQNIMVKTDNDDELQLVAIAATDDWAIEIAIAMNLSSNFQSMS